MSIELTENRLRELVKYTKRWHPDVDTTDVNAMLEQFKEDSQHLVELFDRVKPSFVKLGEAVQHIAKSITEAKHV